MLGLGILASRLRRARVRMRKNSRSGMAAVEFAMVAPAFFLFLFGIIETGVIFFAQSALTNATNDAARMVRTGQIKGDITASQLTDAVCDEMTGMMSLQTCQANLKVDLRVYGGFGGANYPDVLNPDGSLNTNNMAVNSSTACSVVLFRTFYPWTIMTPLMAPLMSNMPSNQYLMTAAAAFRNEPYPDQQHVSNALC